MLSYEEIYKIVESKLSEKRFFHSKCVSERCVEYARIYGLDEEKMKIAGIAHDVAKELPREEQLRLVDNYGVVLDDIEKIHTPLIHAKLGAEIARKDFGCSDDICESIKWHTTGKANMSLMEKIMFMADATGIDRHYDNTEYLYELTKKNIDEAVIALLKDCIVDVVNRDFLVHPKSIEAFNYMLMNRK